MRGALSPLPLFARVVSARARGASWHTARQRPAAVAGAKLSFAGQRAHQGIATVSQSVEIHVNGESRRVSPQTTVAALLAELGVEPRYCAVEVNLELVPREGHSARVLAEGDRLEVVTLVGGG